MASFTDQISSFNPYIAQLPVEAMVQVGMQKQAQYDEGVQKIQAYVDEIGGLPVATDADRKYLQSSLNQLGNNLKYVAAGDFSNQQLVNSVGGMATKIVKDPVIRNAVSSANWYKEQNEKMQKAIDEGKSNPANVDLFNSEVQKWLTSGKAGYKFNSSYTPFFDVDKYAKETFDAIKPGGYTFDELYQTNADGSYARDKQGNYIASPVMMRMKKEGRLPQEVEGAINQIMSDPRVGQQLQISGRYNYKNYAPKGLVDMLYDQRDSTLGGYLDKLADLNLDKKLGKDVQTEIDAVQGNVDTITSSYDKLAQQAIDNPDALKGYLYKQGVVSNYKSIYGSVRSSVEAHENPLWNSNFKMMQEANEQSRFAQRLQWDINNARETRAFTANENKLNRENAKQIAMMGKGKGLSNNMFPGFNMGGDGNGPTRDENPSDVDVVAEAEKQKAEVGAKFLNSSYEFVWDSMFSGSPANDAALTADMKKKGGSGFTRLESIQRILAANAKKAKLPLEDYITQIGGSAVQRVTKNLSTASPTLINRLNSYKEAQKEYSGLLDEEKTINIKASNEAGGVDLGNLLKDADIPSVGVNYNGKKYTLDKQDFNDAAIYLAGHKSVVGDYTSDAEVRAAKAAEARLASRGKAFILPTVLDRYGTGTTKTLDVPTGIVREFKDLTNNIYSFLGGGDTYLRNDQGYGLGVSKMAPGFADATSLAFKGSLDKAYNLITNEKVTKALAKKAELLKESTYFKPAMKLNVLKGDAETDRKTYLDLQTMAGSYIESGKNYADKSEVKNFATAISQKDPDVVQAKTFRDPNNGKILTQLVSYNTNGEVSGRMVISDEEADNRGINMGSLYESNSIAAIRRKVSLNANQRTSTLDPNDVNTYYNNDSYFDKSDFPRMMKTPQGIDIKANFKFQNGLWFPIVYAKDINGRSSVQELEGEVDLNIAVQRLKSLGPEAIPLIVNK